MNFVANDVGSVHAWYSTAPNGQIDTPTGGQKSVGLVLSIGKGGRVRPDVTWVTVRVQEEKDSTTDPSHPVEHPFAQNHVDYTFDLAGPWRKQLCSLETAAAVAGSAETTGSPTAEGPAGWQQFWLYCTQNKPVVSNTARCGNASWNTTQGQTSDADGAGPLLPTTLLGHNGPHSVHIVAWGGSNWSQRESSAQALGNFPFEQKKLDGSGWEAQGFNSALPTLTRNIGNLVIKDVSTSNGTQDYFKFDANGTGTLASPTINFTIEDKGDPHFYRWRVRVRSTDDEQQSNSVVYEGVDTAKSISVTINNSALAGEGSPQQALTEKGTYNFEIRVLEYNTREDAEQDIAASRPRSTTTNGFAAAFIAPLLTPDDSAIVKTRSQDKVNRRHQLAFDLSFHPLQNESALCRV